MPRFDTSEPITAHIESAAGSVHLIATDRSDTVVDVRPHNESRSADIRAAERTRVDFAHGTLKVSACKWGLFGARFGSVDIAVELPSRSRLDVSVVSAQVQADGEYTDCRFAAASGNLAIANVTGNIKADTASGDVTVDSVTGGSVSTASGDAKIGECDGDLKFQAASGDLAVDHLRGNLNARTASGSITVAAAVRGEISAHTSSGDVEVGVPTGTAARLDIMTGSGVVTNSLESSDGPADGDDTLVVHARTGSGNVSVRRAVANPAA
ncbi:MAG TPA: DUF4097 family beta strand repeat-containing protein [Mycobacterium sp.]|nr:DUF4097 family beta strand repeat-containing protein [Mycobacterium sp.]